MVQQYAWGDTASLPAMLGLDPDGRPWAEVWFGTHPSGMSSVAPLDRDATGGLPLDTVAGPLPYMVKLLAAAAPLSLQTHPDADQAARGLAHEAALGIAPGSTAKIYTDPFAKPELLIALTPFRALCGVRPPRATDKLLRTIGGAATRLAQRLHNDGVAATLADYLVDRRPTLALVEACRRHRDIPEAALVLDLEHRYPADPAVAISLLLNLVEMRAGQALYLTPGNLHAYLSGTGVEVMGSSDNVLRAGLTHKHTAIEELLAIVDPTPLTDPVVRPQKVRPGLWRYATPGAPFTVYAEHVDGPTTVHAHARELVLCALGSTDVLRTGEVVYLAPGDELDLDGTATLFRTAES